MADTKDEMPDFIRASATVKEDFQTLFASEQKNFRAIEGMRSALVMLQSSLDQVVSEINRVRSTTEENFTDLETGVEKLTEAAEKTTEEFKSLVRTADTNQNALRGDFKKSHFVLHQVVTVLAGIENQLNTLRNILSEAKSAVDAANTGILGLRDPIAQSGCQLSRYENLPEILETFAGLVESYAAMQPKLEIVVRERLDELGYDPESEAVKKMKPWDRLVSKVWRATTNNFFNVLGMFLLGAIAWVVQATATAKSEAKAMAVTQRMEEMAKTKEAEIKNLQQAIEDLKAQKAQKAQPRKPKPANSPSVQPK